jgi:two-component system LytT family response regulator
MNIKTILIDDEKNSLVILQKLLEKNTPDIEVIATAQSVSEGIKTINEQKPDLIFLDISMPDGDGFEILQKVDYKNFKVIFTTAYDQYAIRAFEVAAIHYILKPVKPEDLKEAIARYKADTNSDFIEKMKIFSEAIKEQEASRLILPTSSGMHIIDIEEIIRCESSNNYTTFFLTDGQKIVVSKPIQLYEQLLSQSHFCRIHNKHIVNLKFIKKYIKGRGGFVLLNDGSHVDVSDGRKKEFIEKLNKYALK